MSSDNKVSYLVGVNVPALLEYTRKMSDHLKQKISQSKPKVTVKALDSITDKRVLKKGPLSKALPAAFAAFHAIV